MTEEFASEFMHISCLGDFAEDVHNLDLDAFIEMHGNAFLIHHGHLGKLRQPPRQGSTLLAEGPPGGASLHPRENFLVFQVRQNSLRPRRPDDPANLVWVGRAEHNDVVIPDASVSNVHAFFKISDDGLLYLQDYGSKNGTFVGDSQVPGAGKGPPVILRAGSGIRFGSVQLTCLDAHSFRTLVLQIAPE